MSADSVNDDRMADYLDDLDRAAEMYALQRRATLPVAALVCDRRMDNAAANRWHDAWRRGLVGDVEMAFYTTIVREHPASWLGWEHQYL